MLNAKVEALALLTVGFPKGGDLICGGANICGFLKFKVSLRYSCQADSWL